MTQLSGKKFVFIVAVILLLSAGLYCALFYYQIGAHVKASWWLKNAYDYKDHIASQTASPKIIVLSGSNALFGIDSTIVEDRTGYPVVNLAGNADLDISFLLVKLKEHTRSGDIVVMPLEFQYFQQSKINYWFANNMLAWGDDDYLKKLGILDLFLFITSVPKSRVYDGVLHQNGKRPILEANEAITNLNHVLSSQGPAWRGYSYLSLNQFGDMVSGENVSKQMLADGKKGIHYYGGWDISDRFFKYYKKIEQLVEDRNGDLILTWSVMMRNPLFDYSKVKYKNRINRIIDNLKKESVTLSCSPELFQYDLEFFFDTKYHLNKNGTAKRSENLAFCINETLEHNQNNN